MKVEERSLLHLVARGRGGGGGGSGGKKKSLKKCQEKEMA